MRTHSYKLLISLLVFFVFSASLGLATPAPVGKLSERYVLYQEPDFLTFEELKRLSNNPSPLGTLGRKLQKFLKIPIISNQAYYDGVRPIAPLNPFLGRMLSVASWNLEKSFHVPRVIRLLTSDEAFRSMVDTEKVTPGSELYRTLERQRKRLLLSDILILQEMEIGLQRSGYLNAAGELAKALKMNYAYGAQYLEVDPVLLGMEKPLQETPDHHFIKSKDFSVDPQRYKGVFGSAVLSRYPIKHVEVVQLKNQSYDWHAGERSKMSFVEKTRRLGSKVVFQNELSREIKVGGRIFFRVDLEVPGLPENTLSVINIHLEIKCLPKARETQMKEILSYIEKIKNPVIVMGDFNAAPYDISPTTIERIAVRTAKDPGTWVSAAVTFLTPYGPLNLVRGATNSLRTLQDPLAKHIPVAGPNPVYPLFDALKNFRFKDGRVFDFRGEGKRSIDSKSGSLSNSNQRDFKGFKTTFTVRRPIGPVIGKYRLDWVFVKSFLFDPEDPKGPHRFAPHYGETLEELNLGMKEPFSDHHPNVVDLPFGEPRL